MRIYLGKGRQNAMQMMTPTHATIRSPTRGVEGIGHKLCTDNFFFSQDLYDDIHMRGINCYGTVRQNCKGIPGGSENKTVKFR